MNLTSDDLDASIARRSLIDFGLRCFPGFKAPPHVRLMAKYLEQLERGEIRRLLVAVSVRHGKSVLCSQAFPPWFVGRQPTKEAVLASYAADLAERNSRVAKSLVESDRWPFFGVSLSSDSKAVTRWNVTQGGGIRAIGVGGGITGHGADVLVIDDPHATASSDADRESAWRWYQETITPRLNAGARVALISARFHDADLAGRILDSDEANQWTVLRLPAICDIEDDPLGRKLGEALWPEHMSAEEIESRRIAMGNVAWSAQFQQAPVPAGGRLFDPSWFERRYKRAPSPYSAFMIQVIDGAWKDGLRNDPSAIATWATDGQRYFIIDQWRGRVTFSDLRETVVAQFLRHRPHAGYAEQAASGYALLDELQRGTSIPIMGVTPKGSKEARAEAVTPIFEAGLVNLPESAPWLDDWIAEHLSFPGGRHDDQVDNTSMALLILHARNLRALERARLDEQMRNFTLAR